MIHLKQKLFFTIILIIILIILAVIFGVLPVAKKIKTTSYNMAFKQFTLDLIDTQLGSLSDFQNKQSVYNKALGQFEGVFIDNSAPVNFIEFLEEQARIAGLKFVIKPLSVSKEKKSNDPIGFQLILEGRFNRGLLFLERIEQSHWLFEISEINVSRFSAKTLLSLKDVDYLNVGDVSLRITIKTSSKP